MADVVKELQKIIEALVDEPDQVKLTEGDVGDTQVIEVEVANSDLGKVIGRQGRTVRSLRTLLEVRGAETGTYYDLEILEN